MKTIFFLLLFICGAFFIHAQEQVIDFSKGDIIIKGKLGNLSIESEIRNNVRVVHSDPDFSYSIKNDKLVINCSSKQGNYEMFIPEKCNINIEAEEIEISSTVNDEMDRSISILGDHGEIEVTTSNHEVDIIGRNNSMSISSIHDILAKVDNINENELIHLDSYLGNIDLFLDTLLNSNFDIIVKEGDFVIDTSRLKDIKLKSRLRDFMNDDSFQKLNIGNGSSDIIIRSQKGDRVEMELYRVDEDIRNINKHDNLIEGYDIFQNKPNPFKRSTKVIAVVPQPQMVEYKIWNEDETYLANFKEFVDVGENTIKIKGSKLNGGGVYYFQLASGDFRKTIKMIYVD